MTSTLTFNKIERMLKQMLKSFAPAFKIVAIVIIILFVIKVQKTQVSRKTFILCNVQDALNLCVWKYKRVINVMMKFTFIIREKQILFACPNVFPIITILLGNKILCSR